MAGGVPADFLDAGAGVLGLIAETFERAPLQAQRKIRFRREDAFRDFA